MKRLLAFACLLSMAACAEPEGPAPAPQAEPLPDYVEAAQGDGYHGVLFTTGRAVVPGLQERGAMDITPYWALPDGASFRRTNGAEVAAFEASLPGLWERHMEECPGGNCPYASGTTAPLEGKRRHYVGYTDSTGGKGLWAFFYPEGEHDGFTVEGYSSWVLMPEHVEDEGSPSFFDLLYSVDRDSLLTVRP